LRPGLRLSPRAYSRPANTDFFDQPDSENFVVHIAGFLTPFMQLRLLKTFPRGGGHLDALYMDLTTSERVRVEWEEVSANFVLHGHDPNLCDVIFCWNDNLTGVERAEVYSRNPKLQIVSFRNLLHHYEFRQTFG
jgi:hypothetical protein